MQVTVYQLQVPHWQNNQHIQRKDRKCYFNKIGVVKGKVIEEENVWHLTNHGCWNVDDETGKEDLPIKAKGCRYIPTQYDRGWTNDDIIFRLNGKWYCADSSGWTKTDTLTEAKKHVFAHGDWIMDHLPENYEFKDIINRK